MTKTYHLTIDNTPWTLTLTPSPSGGYCAGCWKTKEIKFISQPQGSLKRRLCQTCALNNLIELWDYDFKNQSQILGEVRKFLLNPSHLTENDRELLDCYE